MGLFSFLDDTVDFAGDFGDYLTGESGRKQIAREGYLGRLLETERLRVAQREGQANRDLSSNLAFRDRELRRQLSELQLAEAERRQTRELDQAKLLQEKGFEQQKSIQESQFGFARDTQRRQARSQFTAFNRSRDMLRGQRAIADAAQSSVAADALRLRDIKARGTA